MASLDEAASLPSLLLSCSKLFYAFKDAENLIVERIVARELGPGILPEAIARLETAFSSKRLPPSNPDELAKKHLTERKQPSTALTLRQAVVLSRFHFFVDGFTSDYISKTLGIWPQYFHPNRRSAPPVTRTEVTRIQRAFYRFEIFCNIYRNRSYATAHYLRETTDRFFEHFSPWENNQLGCINDYLHGIISPVFNDFVEHDVLWGHLQVTGLNDPTRQYFQYILRRGLQALYKIKEAKSYEDRVKVMYTDFPKLERSFLHCGLKAANSETAPRVALQDLTPLEWGDSIHPPFFDDPDKGPLQAWFTAHNKDLPHRWVYSQQDQAHTHRELGYVMWDSARMEYFNFAFRDKAKAFCERTAEIMRDVEVRKSWDRRELIHLAGGRGRWIEGDESLIVWTGDRSPLDGKAKRKKCEFCIGEVRCAPHRLVLELSRPSDVGKDNSNEGPNVAQERDAKSTTFRSWLGKIGAFNGS